MYTRKISRRSYAKKLDSAPSTFGTVSLPSAVLAAWSDASSVAICYDRDLNVLFLTPIVGDDHVS
jgi:hypothetical protein